MARYGKYKNSGVKWLGSIPNHWDIIPLKFIVTCNDACLSPVENADKRIKYVEISDVDSVTGVNNYTEYNLKEAPSRARRITEKNDVIISTVRTYLKAVAKINENDLIVSTGFAVLRSKKIIHSDFLYYLILSDSFVNRVISYSVGTSYPAITTADMLRLKVFVPPLEEQKAIAAYLDSEVSKIDEAIKQQQKMIELLNERRQIIISEAVTKGVNPAVQMKDSGIDWMGKIPRHWQHRKFKRVAKVQANLVSPKSYPDFPQVAPENIEKGTGKLLEYTTVAESGVISDNHLFQAGQIIYSKIRPTLNKLIVAHFDGLCSADMYPITTSMNVRFLYYYMLSKPFVTQVKKVVMDRVKMPKINKEELSLIYVLVPPVKEQEDIINYLDNRLKSLDMTIARCKNITDRLTERKRIIINEAVTGKIKVL